MPAQRIAIAAHKGGTGKTCTTLACAAALARRGKRCLIIDLDPQGHSTLGLGIEVGDQDRTLQDLFDRNRTPLTDLIRETHLPGLHIVPTDIRLEWATRYLYGEMKRHNLLRAALAPLLPSYDYILMDCPPSLGVLTELAVYTADFVLIPLQKEARARDALLDLLKFIQLVREEHPDDNGKPFERWRILLTRVDSRDAVANRLIDEDLKEWHDRILSTTIPKNTALTQAQIARTDIFTFDAHSPGAIAYDTLTDELLHHV
jgi:chromosome partitioning protein